MGTLCTANCHTYTAARSRNQQRCKMGSNVSSNTPNTSNTHPWKGLQKRNLYSKMEKRSEGSRRLWIVCTAPTRLSRTLFCSRHQFVVYDPVRQMEYSFIFVSLAAPIEQRRLDNHFISHAKNIEMFFFKSCMCIINRPAQFQLQSSQIFSDIPSSWTMCGAFLVTCKKEPICWFWFGKPETALTLSFLIVNNNY